MCKHVAAALYGTAVRLDEKPELFFILRGIQIADFVGEMVKHETKKLLKRANAKSERVLAANKEELSQLFGIVMDEKLAQGSAGVVQRVPAKGKKQSKSAVPPKMIVRVVKKKDFKDHMKKAMARSKSK